MNWLSVKIVANAVLLGTCIIPPQGFWSIPALAQQALLATKTVVSTGLGRDIESAIKNAAENALSQVVGTFIDTETQIQKKTEILNGIRNETNSLNFNMRSYSQGSIRSIEVLSTENRDGLVNVQARFDVQIEDFKAYIKKVAAAETQVKQGIFAQLSTLADNSNNAKDIIYNTIALPILNSEVIEITMGNMITLTNSKIFDQLKRSHNVNHNFDPTKSVVIPINLSLNPDFLQNLYKKLNNISNKKSDQNPDFCDPISKNDICIAITNSPTTKTAEVYIIPNSIDKVTLENMRSQIERSQLIVDIKDSKGKAIAKSVFYTRKLDYGSETSISVSGDIKGGLVCQREPLGKPANCVNLIAIHDYHRGGHSYGIEISKESSFDLVLEIPMDVLQSAASITLSYGQ